MTTKSPKADEKSANKSFLNVIFRVLKKSPVRSNPGLLPLLTKLSTGAKSLVHGYNSLAYRKGNKGQGNRKKLTGKITTIDDKNISR